MSVRQIAAQGGCYYAASQATTTTLKPEQPGKVRYVLGWTIQTLFLSSIYSKVILVACKRLCKLIKMGLSKTLRKNEWLLL